MRLIGLRIALALSFALAPLAAEAQQAGKVWRIGVLAAVSPEGAPRTEGLRRGLRELGYVEGQNISTLWRWAHGDVTRFPALAAELVRLEVDVIVADNNPAIAAPQRATTTIPIVMVIAPDPVRMGFVASLAKPGGNITGLSFQGLELTGKRLQFLKEALPTLSRVAALWDPTEPGRAEGLKEAEDAARTLKVQFLPVALRSPSELEDAFAAMTKARADGVMIMGSSMMFAHRVRIADLIAKTRLPSVCSAGGDVKVGCLISYSAIFNDMFRRAAVYVDKILKGARPATLPVEQPTKFELVINLRIAKALALTIPQSLLLRADQVIE